MKTRKTANESMNQKVCGCNDYEYCEKHTERSDDGATRHTPGPWKVEPYIFQDEKRLRVRKDTDGLASYIAEVCQEGTICEEHGGNPVANARLIAAAPDLLEALKAVSQNPTQYDKWMEAVVDAIAKANGR